ncbi:MAG: hypothetical protein ACYCZ7_00525 [Minisyncoccota bacterium]
MKLKPSIFKISYILLGVFFAGVSVFGIFNTAQAACTTQCVGGYETQSYSCVTSSAYWPGGYFGGNACFGAGYYPAGTYDCWGTCTQQVWNSCLSTTQVCTPDPCYGSGTLTWGAGCSATGSYSAPDGGSATAGNTAAGYTGSITYSCSNGSWGGPTSSSCSPVCTQISGTASCNQDLTAYGVPAGYTVGTASYTYNSCTLAVTYIGGCTLPPAPTSVSVSVSPSSVVTDKSFTASWGATNATSYTLSLGGVTADMGSATSWTGTPASLGLTAGTYTLGVTACNTGGCTTGSTSFTVTAPVAPTTVSVSVSPSPVQTAKSFTATWTGNNNPTNYILTLNGLTYDIGSGTSWTGTPDSLALPPGTYTLSVEARNSAGSAIGYSNPLRVVGKIGVIASFRSDKNVLPAEGGSVTFEWSSLNTVSCSITGGGLNIANLPPTGTYVIPNVTSSALFGLTCKSQ